VIEAADGRTTPGACANNYRLRFDDRRNSAQVAAKMAKLPSAGLLIYALQKLVACP